MNRAGMLPKGERVTLMFSATYPEEIQNMAKGCDTYQNPLLNVIQDDG